MSNLCGSREFNTKYYIWQQQFQVYTHSMATQFGRLQEFKPETDSIKSYLDKVADGKKVLILLSSIGAPIYALFSNLLHLARNHLMTFQRRSAIILSLRDP